ncbi:MAG: type II secretion system protein GspE, partial [Gammaproteobacteria bacterium]|nr:type II secretion system protein GspE [Gammaproteobacteria bacterium]
SQRLVRNLCSECRTPLHLNDSEYEDYGLDSSIDIYQSQGCPACLQTGYRGRSGIYEMIEVDDKLSSMIHDGESQAKIERYCRTKSPSIRDDGMRKVEQGMTTIDEVLRVTRENL